MFGKSFLNVSKCIYRRILDLAHCALMGLGALMGLVALMALVVLINLASSAHHQRIISALTGHHRHEIHCRTP